MVAGYGCGKPAGLQIFDVSSADKAVLLGCKDDPFLRPKKATYVSELARSDLP